MDGQRDVSTELWQEVAAHGGPVLVSEESLHWALQGGRLGYHWPVVRVHELPVKCLGPFCPQSGRDCRKWQDREVGLQTR